MLCSTNFNYSDKMVALWCGFNCFKQIDDSNEICIAFQEIPVSNIKQVDFAWSSAIIIAGYEVYISGFCGNTFSSLKKITTPHEQMKFSKVACGEGYALFALEGGECWQFFYSTQQWKKLSNFCDVEEIKQTNICSETSELLINKGDKSTTSVKELIVESNCKKEILKICCGETLNVALDNQGLCYSIPSPIIMPGIKVTDVACGFEHCLMLDECGRVFSWGSGMRGQLGHDVLETSDVPMEIDALGGLNVTHIAAGGWHSAAVTSSGDLYTWGWNNSGQLGFPTVESSHGPSTSNCDKKQYNYESMTNKTNRDTEYETECNRGVHITKSTKESNCKETEKTYSSVKNFKRAKLCASKEVSEFNSQVSTVTRKKSFRLDDTISEESFVCVDPENVNKSPQPCENASKLQITSNYDCTSTVVSGKLQGASECVTVLAVPQSVCFPSDRDVDVVDVSCGYRHTVVLAGDGSIWGCGWNAYGQLGKSPDVMLSTDSMITIDVVRNKMKIYGIHCGGWNTAVFFNDKI